MVDETPQRDSVKEELRSEGCEHTGCERATGTRRNLVDETTSAISTNLALLPNRIPGVSVSRKPESKDDHLKEEQNGVEPDRTGIRQRERGSAGP